MRKVSLGWSFHENSNQVNNFEQSIMKIHKSIECDENILFSLTFNCWKDTVFNKTIKYYNVQRNEVCVLLATCQLFYNIAHKAKE